MILNTAAMTNEFQMLINQAARPGLRTPQFPGVLTQSGDVSKQIEAVQTFIKKQKRTRGFRFVLAAGVNPAFQIDISGSAKMFLGFSILLDDEPGFGGEPTAMTLTVNNEVVIQETRPAFFSPAFMDEEYYFFPRPLSGQDDVILNVTAVAPTTMFMVVYYL